MVSWDLLGFGLVQLAYIQAFSLFTGLGQMPFDLLRTYWVFAVFAAVLAGCAPFFKVTIPCLRSLSIVVALSAFILGPILFAVGSSTVQPVSIFGGVVLLSVGCSLLWIVWEDKFAELDDANITLYVVICAAVMAVFNVAASLAPDVRFILLVCAQLGSVVMVLSEFRAGTWGETHRRPSAAMGSTVFKPSLSPSIAIVTMFVFALSYRFATETVFSNTVYLFRDAEDILSALVMFAILMVAKRCNFPIILRISMPLMILSYFAVQLAPENMQPVCIIVSGSASKLVSLCLVIEVIRSARDQGGRSRWVILSLGVAALFAGRFVGDLCGEAVARLGGAANSEAITMYALAAILALTLLILLPFHGERGAKAESNPRFFESAVQSAASEFGLTPREAEVLELLAQGRTQAIIADRLCISTGTAHAHINRIYRKMEVHSQQELLDLMEEKTPLP